MPGEASRSPLLAATPSFFVLTAEPCRRQRVLVRLTGSLRVLIEKSTSCRECRLAGAPSGRLRGRKTGVLSAEILGFCPREGKCPQGGSPVWKRWSPDADKSCPVCAAGRARNFFRILSKKIAIHLCLRSR